jgi:hypothetical protein
MTDSDKTIVPQQGSTSILSGADSAKPKKIYNRAYKALHDFNGQGPGEMSLTQGELVKITKEGNNGV